MNSFPVLNDLNLDIRACETRLAEEILQWRSQKSISTTQDASGTPLPLLSLEKRKQEIAQAESRIGDIQKELHLLQSFKNSLTSSSSATIPQVPNLPTLNPSNRDFDIKSFMSQFELRVSAANVPPENWSRILLSTAPSFESAIAEFIHRSLDFPWTIVKNAVISRCVQVDDEEKFFLSFTTISVNKNESIREFSERYVFTASRARICTESKVFKSKYLSALPEKLRLRIDAEASKCATLAQIIQLATSVDDLMADANSYSASMVQKSTAAPTSTPDAVVSTVFCRYCRKSGHLIEDCRKRAYSDQLRASGSIPSSYNSSNFSNSTNSTNFTNSTNSSNSSNSSNSLNATQSNSWSSPNKFSPLNSTNQPSSPGPFSTKRAAFATPAEATTTNAGSSLINISITIQDTECQAFIDSGSEISIINSQLAAQLNLPCEPTTLRITQIGARSEIPALAVARNVQVKQGLLSGAVDFYVVDTDPEISVTLGLDAFKTFSWFICGLSTVLSPQEEDSVISCADDFEVQETLPLEEYEPLMATLEPFLVQNLSTEEFPCNLPSAVVRLPTLDAPPSKKPQFLVSDQMNKVVDAQVAEWREQEIIKFAPPGCCWNSSLLVVKKHSPPGEPPKFRVCLDPRHINAVLVDDFHQIPILRDLLDSLSGSAIFSTLDLLHSYHQFPVAPEDQPKTAFTWRGVQYVFVGAPFGLKTLTAIFQRVMSQLFFDLPFVKVYVDDIIVHSSTKEEHAVHLQKTIDRLTLASLTLNAKKCKFFLTKFRALGHEISSEGVTVDPTKVDDALAWHRPKTGRDIQSFLGFMNYLRDFIPQFAFISKPLDSLREAGKIEHLWQEEHELAFNTLKQVLTEAPLLAFPDYSKPFIIATDASAFAIGGILLQCKSALDFGAEPIDSKNSKFIKFASRSLKSAEKRYSASKRELLSIVYSLQKFSNYLTGQKVIVLTDHKPLSYIFSQKSLSELQFTWFDTLNRFDIEIIYCPGRFNVLPDALSRLFPDFSSEAAPESQALSLLLTSSLSLPATAEPSIASSPEDSSTVTFSDDALALSLGKSIPSPAEQICLLNTEHEMCHAGPDQLYRAIVRKGFYWKSLAKDCKAHYSNCVECQRHSITKAGYHPQQSLLADSPFDHVCIDLVGSLPENMEGMKHILVIVDVFTKFIILKPIKDKTALTVARELYNVFCLFGFPKILQSDNGLEFSNATLNELLRILKTEFRHSSAYYPQANGLAERSVRTTLDLLRKFCDGITCDWPSLLPSIQLRINQRAPSSTNSTPFAIMFCRSLTSFSDYTNSPTAEEPTEESLQARLDTASQLIFPAISEASRVSKEKINKRWNKNHNLVPLLSIGSCVMALNPVKESKLDIRYLGPYSIFSVSKSGSYRLADAVGNVLKRTFPRSFLKPIPDAPLSSAFYVERIITHRFNQDNQILYQVRWFGYESADDTWEPVGSFNDMSIISNYHASLPGGGSDVHGTPAHTPAHTPATTLATIKD